MVASSAGSAINRLNISEAAGSPLSKVIPGAVHSGHNLRSSQLSETPPPNSPGSCEADLVARFFPTSPQIFGTSQAQLPERDDALDDPDSVVSRKRSELQALEAEVLCLSRMLKSLQPLDTFPGFPTSGLAADIDSPKSNVNREAQTWRTADTAQASGGELGDSMDDQTGLRSERGLWLSTRDKNESFGSGNYSSTLLTAPKSPKSKRRNHGLSFSSRGSTPNSSIGSASELQFPAVDLRSPPSPEPLGSLRPGSPLKWRSKNSSVSPVEDILMESRTPVQGLVVARNPSFSEYIASNFGGKFPFEDVKKKPEVVEPDPSVVARKLKAAYVETDEDEVLRSMMPEGASPLESNGRDISFALEYQGPPIDHVVPKVEPMDSRSIRNSNDRLHSPSHGARGSVAYYRGISASLTNPFPAWFSSDRDKSQRDISSPSSSSDRSVDRGGTSVPLSPRSRTPPLFPSEQRGRDKVRLSTDATRNGLEQDHTEARATLTSSPVAGPQASPRTSAGTSDDESKVDSPPVLRPSVSRSFGSFPSGHMMTKSEPVGLWKLQTTLDNKVEDPVRQRPRSMSLPGMQAIASLGSQAVGSHLTPTNYEVPSVPNPQQRKKGECYLCHKGNRLSEKESCLVCNAKYCYACVLTAMESMPEGRKCRTCIGKSVDEAKRASIGKPSRLLNRLLSPQEVQQIMKAEKECAANQLRPEQLYVNGRQLTPEELALLLKSPNPPQKLKPGRYWYDRQSGLWGKEGEKPDKLISPDMKVGGDLQENASNGTTKVFMNGRELGKLELKMLKLAGVHCPTSTHLWVEADGSYQEEGQNNSKGNIWNKTSIKLLYPFFSLPTPGGSARYTKEVPRDSPDVYVPGYVMQNKLHKILILGHEGSGRSTLFKQTKFLFKDGFTREERAKMKSMIQCNIYRYISILLEGRERFEEEEEELRSNRVGYTTGDYSGEASGSSRNMYVLDARLKQRAEWFLEMMAEGSLELVVSASSSEFCLLVDELWRDPSIRATHKRKDELSALPDNAEYFLDKVVAISSSEYEPSDEDILCAEGLAQGSGLAEVEFSLDDKMPSYQDHDVTAPGRYQLIKVGGKGLAEGCKWLDMFEDVHAVVFVVAISEFDQVSTDCDGVISSKLRQTELFDSVLKHPILGEKPMVLLLNKYDLFEGKICKGIPLTSCEWFSDFRPVEATQVTAQIQAQQGYTYVVHKYKELFASTGHKLFTFKLNAIVKEQVLEAFQYVREILKWRDNGWDLIPEESSYSTDLSSYSQHSFPTSGRDGFPFDRNSRRSMEL